MESSPSAPLDAAELLTALARHDVDCVMIGGAAMQVHAHVRTAQDVDVAAAWTPKNRTALARALDELDASLRGWVDKAATPRQAACVPARSASAATALRSVPWTAARCSSSCNV